MLFNTSYCNSTAKFRIGCDWSQWPHCLARLLENCDRVIEPHFGQRCLSALSSAFEMFTKGTGPVMADRRPWGPTRYLKHSYFNVKWRNQTPSQYTPSLGRYGTKIMQLNIIMYVSSAGKTNDTQLPFKRYHLNKGPYKCVNHYPHNSEILVQIFRRYSSHHILNTQYLFLNNDLSW